MLSEFKPYQINLRKGKKTFQRPIVMGILNTTIDSFFDGGKYHTIDLALRQCEKMLQEGAEIIDVGGQSTRPGADIIDQATEIERTAPVIEAIKKRWPECIISIDTFRSEVAKVCLDCGAEIVNDVSAGDDDPGMLPLIAKTGVSYIAMHKKGQPKTMQNNPEYYNVTEEVKSYFHKKIEELEVLGHSNIIVDPGFGFGKTLRNNYELMNRLNEFADFGKPILVGISRKSMIWKLLETNPENALNGTSSLNTIALMNGAHILRVHDVKEAVECVKITEALRV